MIERGVTRIRRLESKLIRIIGGWLIKFEEAKGEMGEIRDFESEAFEGNIRGRTSA